MLQRAISSIRNSSKALIHIITVVNGTRADGKTCDWLKRQCDIQLLYVATPSAPGAVQAGRQLVQSEFFSCLDDDDEHLSGATDAKVSALMLDKEAYLVVTNAYRCLSGVDRLMYSNLSGMPVRPLENLMRFNCFHNGNALFRSAAVDPSYFDNYHQYADWTWLAFRLVMDGKRVAVLDIPTFRYNDTDGSLSKSRACRNSYMPVFQRIVDRSPPPHIMKIIRHKLGAAYHDASDAALVAGLRGVAWGYHLMSLVHTGGLKYLSYTRNLFK